MAKTLRELSRMIEAHNKIVEKAVSASAKERVSRNVFNALRESFYQTNDARARSRPGMFHHLYEWGSVGEGGSRLYRLTSAGRGTTGFAISYDFLPSSAPVPGSEPHVFFEKARVMEENTPVVIEPLDGGVLSFEYDGNRVFTPGPIAVDNPGGPATKDALRKSFMTFFRPSVIKNNPAYKAIIDAEQKRVFSAIKAAK